MSILTPNRGSSLVKLYSIVCHVFPTRIAPKLSLNCRTLTGGRRPARPLTSSEARTYSRSRRRAGLVGLVLSMPGPGAENDGRKAKEQGGAREVADGYGDPDVLIPRGPRTPLHPSRPPARPPPPQAREARDQGPSVQRSLLCLAPPPHHTDIYHPAFVTCDDALGFTRRITRGKQIRGIRRGHQPPAPPWRPPPPPPRTQPPSPRPPSATTRADPPA
jgi:hypothetical protein